MNLISPEDFAGSPSPPAQSGLVNPQDFAGGVVPPKPQPSVVAVSPIGEPIFDSADAQDEFNKGRASFNGWLLQKVAEGASFGLAPLAEAPIASAFTGKPVAESLQNIRNFSDETAQKYPGFSTLMEGAGMAVPTLLTAGLINPAESAIGRAAQAGAMGGATGGVAAAGHDIGSGNTENIIPDTAKGSGIGAAFGAGSSAVNDLVISPLVNWIARKINPEAVNSQAVQRVVQRIQQDQKAGGPNAQDMLDALNAAGSEPHTIADVGGNNILGEAGRVSRAPGAGKQVAINALNTRDAAEGANLANVVGSNISNGGSAYNAGQALIEARANAAAPAYQKAGIPSDPAQYPQAPVVDNPQVTRLLQKSKAVQSAIAQAKSLPDYADLPDNSIVLLDKAYKNIGGQANAAKISGDGESSRDLNSLRVQLQNAITGGDQNHPYQLALDAYSGPSQSLDALNLGTDFMKRRPEANADLISGLSPGDKELYKLGAADTLISNVSKSGRSANEANAISRNDYMRQQIRPLFDSDSSYQNFIGAVERANRRFETRFQTIGNSATAGRIAEDDAAGHGNSPLANIAETGVGLATGEKFPMFQGAINFARGLSGNRPPSDPAVNEAISRILFETDPKNRAAVMGRILSQMNGAPKARIMAPTIGSLAGAGYPSLAPSPSMIGQQLMQPGQ